MAYQLQNLDNVEIVDSLGNLLISGNLTVSGTSATVNGFNVVTSNQTGNFITNGETGVFNNVFYPLNTNPSVYITSGQTGNFVTNGMTGGLVSSVNTGQFITLNDSRNIDLYSNIETVGCGGIGRFQNLLTYSNQFSTWGFIGLPTLTANYSGTTAPDGSTTSTQYYTTGGSIGIYQESSFLSSGQPYIASLWMKGLLGVESVQFGINNINYNNITLTTGWVRYFYYTTGLTYGAGNDTQIQVLTNSSGTFYLWGAQLENRNSPPTGMPGLYVNTSAMALSGIQTGIVANCFYSGATNLASFFVSNAQTGGFIDSAKSGLLTGTFYPLNGNPSNFVTSLQTGNFITNGMTGGFVSSGNTGAFVTIYQTGNFITNGETGIFPTLNNANIFTNTNTFEGQSNYFGTNITGARLQVYNGNPGIWLQYTDGNAYYDSSGSFYFRTNINSGVNSIPLFINLNNNIGINTISPAYTLDVNGTGNFRSGLYVNGVSVVISNQTGNFITNGMTGILTNLFVENIQTGNFLTNGMTGALTNLFIENTQTGNFITNGMTGGFASAGMTGQFITTAQTGQFVSTGLTGRFITNNQTGNFITNGQTGVLSNSFYPLNSNPANYVTSATAGGVSSLNITGYSISGVIVISGYSGVQILTGSATQLLVGFNNNLFVSPSATGNFITNGETGVLANSFYPLNSNPNFYVITNSNANLASLSTTSTICISGLGGITNANSSLILKDNAGQAFAVSAGIPNISESGFSITLLTGYVLGSNISNQIVLFTINSAGIGNFNSGLQSQGNFVVTVNQTGGFIDSAKSGLLVNTFYPLNANPSGYVITSTLSNYVTTSATGNFITNGETGILSNSFYPLNSNPDSYVTSSQTGVLVATNSVPTFNGLNISGFTSIPLGTYNWSGSTKICLGAFSYGNFDIYVDSVGDCVNGSAHFNVNNITANWIPQVDCQISDVCGIVNPTLYYYAPTGAPWSSSWTFLYLLLTGQIGGGFNQTNILLRDISLLGNDFYLNAYTGFSGFQPVKIGQYVRQALNNYNAISGWNIGIANNNPQYSLDVSGNGNFSSGLYVSGISVVTVNQTGGFIDSAKSGLLINAFYPLNSNPDNYVVTSTLSSYVPTSATGNFVTNGMTGVLTNLFVGNTQTGNFITNGQTGIFATLNNSNIFNGTNTFNSNVYVLDYLGIGTSSPGYILQINTSNNQPFGVFCSNTGIGPLFDVYSTTGQDVNVRYGTYSGAYSNYWTLGINHLNGNYQISPGLYTTSLINTSGCFNITQSQKVGIGTTNPQHVLDVVGDGNFSTALYVGGISVVTVNQTGGFIDSAKSGLLVNAFYPLNSNPSNYLTSVQTGNFITNGQTGQFLTLNDERNIDLYNNIEVVGAGGLGTLQNLLTYSNQFLTSPWLYYCGSSGVIVNYSGTIAPDGSTTSTQIISTGANGCLAGGNAWGILQGGGTSLVSGAPYIASVWAKGALGGEQFCFGIDDSNSFCTGLTKNWKRYIFNTPSGVGYIPNAESPRYFQCIVAAEVSATVYIWGAQLESRTGQTPGVYVNTLGNPLTSIQTGIVSDSFWSGSTNLGTYFVSTGQTGLLTNVFYPLNANPASYATTSALSSYVLTSATGNFITNGETGVLSNSFYPLNNNPSSYVQSSQTGIFATLNNANVFTNNNTFSSQNTYFGNQSIGARLNIGQGTNAGIWIEYTDGNAYYDSSGGFYFRTNVNTSLNTAVYIGQGGAVGVNTVSPSCNFDVNGTGNFRSGLYVNGVSVYLSSNPAGYITSSSLSSYVLTSSTGNFITNGETGVLANSFYPLNSNPDNYITSSSLSNYVTTSQTGTLVPTGLTGRFATVTGAQNVFGNTNTFLQTVSLNQGAIVVGNLYDGNEINLLNATSRLLYNTAGSETVDFTNLILTGGNWTAQGIIISGSNVIYASQTGILVSAGLTGRFAVLNGAGNTFGNTNTFNNTSTFVGSIVLDDNVYDNSSVEILDSANRTLFNTAGTETLDFNKLILTGGNWSANTLLISGSSVVISSQTGQFITTAQTGNFGGGGGGSPPGTGVNYRAGSVSFTNVSMTSVSYNVTFTSALPSSNYAISLTPTNTQSFVYGYYASSKTSSGFTINVNNFSTPSGDTFDFDYIAYMLN